MVHGSFFLQRIRILNQKLSFVTGRKPLPQQGFGSESKVLFASFSFGKKKDAFSYHTGLFPRCQAFPGPAPPLKPKKFSPRATNRSAQTSYRLKGGDGMAPTSNRPVDWAQLVSDHENRLYRAALAILGHRQEAEDAVQDAFVKYLEKAPRELDNPGAWLMRVLVNNCKSRLRLQWRQVVSLPEDLAAPDAGARRELEEIWSLPAADRAVLHLHYYEGYSTGEIARLLRQPPGTVRSRLSRARQRLKTLLENE